MAKYKLLRFNTDTGELEYYLAPVWTEAELSVVAAAAWGAISGTLSDQTDLQTALNGKSATSHDHAGVYSPVAHDHAGVYSPVAHNHDSAYEAAGAVATHAAASDPHTGYQRESEKASANGYAGLDANGRVPIAQLASGTPDGTKFIRDDGTLQTPAGGDVVYVGTAGDTAVNNAADVTIVTRDVAGVAAGDQVLVDAWFTILNNSTATRVYTVTLDFDGLFDIEFSTGACAFSATLMHFFRVQAVCDIRASNLAYAMAHIQGQLAAGVASGGDTTMAATHLEAKGWGTSASDATGTLTVALKVRSANNTATQTLRLHSFTVRKVRPT